MDQNDFNSKGGLESNFQAYQCELILSHGTRVFVKATRSCLRRPFKTLNVRYFSVSGFIIQYIFNATSQLHACVSAITHEYE